MTHYFGVRHLSPACAYYVRRFLDSIDPVTVLIEGPSDLIGLIPDLCSDNAVLPAAILAFTEESPIRSVLWPFAEFSPEYQAMKWAIEKGRKVLFCDLPADAVLSHDDDEEKSSGSDNVYTELDKITGVDNESFWEYSFEQCSCYEDFIEAVKEYGKNIRELSESDPHNELREAWMRMTVAQEEKAAEGGNIAVICGAFHTLGIEGKPFSEDDKRLTDKIKRVKAMSTLMPYSYFRLSSRAGYGAGSKAPAYFEILWNYRKHAKSSASVSYLTRIAAYQRQNGYYASTAEVMEAKRLADALAKMRGAKEPCLSDLRDAAVTCIGHGSFGEISLACADTEIGTKIGSLPEGTVKTAVQEDFLRQLKELKLEKYKSGTAQLLELDLRENLRVKSEKSAFLDLHRSCFLHKLRILDTGFAERTERYQSNATWAENWQLQWTPEAEIRLVEASLKGNTIDDAVRNILNMRLAEAQSVAVSCRVLTDVFMCGLTDCVKTAAAAVEAKAAECTSADETGRALGELSALIRFGSIRRIDNEPVIPLMEKLFLRFCLELPNASICDYDAAKQLCGAVTLVNDACLSHNELDGQRFINLLLDLADSDMASPVISGFSCAVLTEQGKISSDKLSELISRRLSKGTPPAEGAQWFEGLSMKNRRSLISRLSIWEKLLNFISELDDEEFKAVLICLRRTFSDFSPSEKSDIAENIAELMGVSVQQAAEFITAPITQEEQQSIDELDDFDFGDI